MKTIGLCTLLITLMALPAIGDLTDTDLDKIRILITEATEDIRTDVAALKTDVAVLKTDVTVLKTDVAALRTDVAVLKTESATVKTEIRDLKESIKSGFDRQNNIIIACIGLPFVILAIIVTVLGILLANKRNTQNEAQQKQIEALIQEVETLRKQQIIPGR